MTWRALSLGFLLGLLISAGTYFNDAVIRQTYMTGNHFPLIVFGTVVVLLVAINPLLRQLGTRAPLRAGEIAIIAAIALAACGWPGSNFYRVATTIVTTPTRWVQTKPAWQSMEIMSYVPGGSPRLAPGHVTDWPAMAGRVRAAGQGAADADAPAERLWAVMEDADRALFQRAPEAGPYDSAMINRLTRALNRALGSPELYAPDAFPDVALPDELARDLATLQAEPDELSRGRVVTVNRALLAEAMSQLVLPAPPGDGVMVGAAPGEQSAVEEMMVPGDVPLGEIPWSTWWPTIRLWGGLAIALAIASLCMAVIVHPQWSQRELLPYPIPRFIDLATETDPNHPGLPRIFYNRLFWYGFIALVLLHLINGLHAWYPQLPGIPLRLDLNPLRELFPNARRVPSAFAYFSPPIFPTVVAFSFFLTGAVAFSLGISQGIYMAFGSVMLASGLAVGGSMFEANESTMLRFGGYAGMAGVILYVGRRYYLHVAQRAIGLGGTDASATSAWAARILAATIIISVALLVGVGTPWWLALIVVLLLLMIYLVLSRIIAETGCFFIQAWWMPLGVLTALVGMEAIGPTPYLVLGIATILFAGDPREAIMPYLTNGLKMAERTADTPPRRMAPSLGAMLLIGFVVAGVVTLWFQYNHGFNQADGWALVSLPSMPFNQLATEHADLLAEGNLAEATTASALERLASIRPDRTMVIWAMVGLAVVLATGFARLRLPWWPLHPVAFLVIGVYPAAMFAASFLIGWLVKLIVVRVGGAKGYHAMQPLMIGVIAGELTAGLGWAILGAIYYLLTDQPPPRYAIFPG